MPKAGGHMFIFREAYSLWGFSTVDAVPGHSKPGQLQRGRGIRAILGCSGPPFSPNTWIVSSHRDSPIKYAIKPSDGATGGRCAAPVSHGLCNTRGLKLGKLIQNGADFGERGSARPSCFASFAAAAEQGARVLWGGCEALFTPPPLAPAAGHSRQIGGDFPRTICEASGRHEISMQPSTSCAL